MRVCFCIIVIFISSYFYGQHRDSLSNSLNKNGFSVSANFVYNFCTSRKVESRAYPWGKIPNSTSGDSVYFMKYKYLDTKTFNVSLSYNKTIGKNLSFSFGIGIYQKKQIQKYYSYIDSNIYKPDIINNTYTKYSLFIPIRLSYNLNRLIISAGNNINYNFINQSVDKYDDNTKRINNYNYPQFNVYFQETIGYQLFKDKGLYATISAEQSGRFYWNYGYNNWFMFGINHYF